MNEETRYKLLADIKAKRQVFRAEKILKEFEAGPYTVVFKRKCRLECDADGWEVSLMRWYSRITAAHFDDFDRARSAFEELKERAIIDLAVEALGLNRVVLQGA